MAHYFGHRDHTVLVAFSPDGRLLASTGGDGSLKLWHRPTGREVAILRDTGAHISVAHWSIRPYPRSQTRSRRSPDAASVRFRAWGWPSFETPKSIFNKKGVLPREWACSARRR